MVWHHLDGTCKRRVHGGHARVLLGGHGQTHVQTMVGLVFLGVRSVYASLRLSVAEPLAGHDCGMITLSHVLGIE